MGPPTDRAGVEACTRAMRRRMYRCAAGGAGTLAPPGAVHHLVTRLLPAAELGRPQVLRAWQFGTTAGRLFLRLSAPSRPPSRVDGWSPPRRAAVPVDAAPTVPPFQTRANHAQQERSVVPTIQQ